MSLTCLQGSRRDDEGTNRTRPLPAADRPDRPELLTSFFCIPTHEDAEPTRRGLASGTGLFWRGTLRARVREKRACLFDDTRYVLGQTRAFHQHPAALEGWGPEAGAERTDRLRPVARGSRWGRGGKLFETESLLLGVSQSPRPTCSWSVPLACVGQEGPHFPFQPAVLSRSTRSSGWYKKMFAQNMVSG
eukprot:450418-Hanusia_phi.AAC.2